MGTLSADPEHIAEWLQRLAWDLEREIEEFSDAVEYDGKATLPAENLQDVLIEHVKEIIKVIPFIATLREQRRAELHPPKKKTRKK